MKKLFITILLAIITVLSISCKNDGGSIYAMEKRYKNFLNILPNDIKDDFSFDSKKYGNEYKMWRDDFNLWVSNTIKEENVAEKEIASRIAPDKIEYAIETLTSKNYERNLPYDLMSNVKNHTDKLAIEIKELEKESSFSNSLYELKKDEAIEHFTPEDTVFYYIWNYSITLERSRRFQ